MNKTQIFQYVLMLIGSLFVLLTLVQCFFTVRQQEVAIVERLGKFRKLGHAGLNMKVPWIDFVADTISLQVQELLRSDGTVPRAVNKTSDDVMVTLWIQVQYAVIKGREFDAYYLLEDPEGQMFSWMYDAVRAKVPKMTFNEVFAEKEAVALTVAEQLKQAMEPYGYSFKAVLITSVDPDDKVKEALGARKAAAEQGEADRILVVKKAEAEAQNKALQGKGIADQRRAIIEGLRDSVADFQNAIPGSTAQDVMNLVLMTQYFDTLKELGNDSKTNTVMIPHSPGALADISAQIRNAIISADAAKT